MNRSVVISGIVFPEGILAEPWFAVFGLFVAFNTIIYLGLTVSKFIPWPAPIHPTTVRQIIPTTAKEDPVMRSRNLPRSPRAQSPLTNLISATTRETVPLAMGLTGAVAILAGIVNVYLYIDQQGPVALVGAGFGFVLIIVSQILMRARVNDKVMIWTWTILMILLIIETSWRAEVLDSAVVLSYAVIALLVTAPITLSWSAGLTSAVVGLIPIIVSGYSVSLVDTVSWTIAALTAALAALVLLRLRMSAIEGIAHEQQRANTLASTDSLTGVFSRTGLLALAPTIAAAAERSNSTVSVVRCDVDSMSSINSDYGISYGDEVLSATARALSVSLPDDAIVSRWDGDEFLALFLGPLPDLSELTRATTDALVYSGIALGKRPVTVTLSGADGNPHDTTLEHLIAKSA